MRKRILSWEKTTLLCHRTTGFPLPKTDSEPDNRTQGRKSSAPRAPSPQKEPLPSLPVNSGWTSAQHGRSGLSVAPPRGQRPAERLQFAAPGWKGRDTGQLCETREPRVGGRAARPAARTDRPFIGGEPGSPPPRAAPSRAKPAASAPLGPLPAAHAHPRVLPTAPGCRAAPRPHQSLDESAPALSAGWAHSRAGTHPQ